jgi:VIT1/CCC1 family predicted Fe2+/Mn2+ transporter
MKLLDLIDNRKSYSALAILGVVVPLCPLFGVPAAVTLGLTVAGTALGIIGRVHAGSKIEAEKEKVVELAGQVNAMRQYIKDGQRR